MPLVLRSTAASLSFYKHVRIVIGGGCGRGGFASLCAFTSVRFRLRQVMQRVPGVA